MRKNTIALILAIAQMVAFSSSKPIFIAFLAMSILITLSLLKKTDNRATTVGFYFLLAGVTAFTISSLLIAFYNSSRGFENLGYAMLVFSFIAVCELGALVSYTVGLLKVKSRVSNIDKILN